MENKSIRMPLMPIIILIIIIVIVIGLINNSQKENVNGQDTNKLNEKAKVTFEVEDMFSKAGEEITIKIRMLEDSNFVAANFELLYDDTKMQFVKYKKEEILNNSAMSIINNDEDESKVLIGYIGNPQDEENIVPKGELISITFKINESVDDTKIKPELKCTTLKQKDGRDIENVIKLGVITLESKVK